METIGHLVLKEIKMKSCKKKKQHTTYVQQQTNDNTSLRIGGLCDSGAPMFYNIPLSKMPIFHYVILTYPC